MADCGARTGLERAASTWRTYSHKDVPADIWAEICEYLLLQDKLGLMQERPIPRGTVLRLQADFYLRIIVLGRGGVVLRLTAATYEAFADHLQAGRLTAHWRHLNFAVEGNLNRAAIRKAIEFYPLQTLGLPALVLPSVLKACSSVSSLCVYDIQQPLETLGLGELPHLRKLRIKGYTCYHHTEFEWSWLALEKLTKLQKLIIEAVDVQGAFHKAQRINPSSRLHISSLPFVSSLSRLVLDNCNISYADITPLTRLATLCLRQVNTVQDPEVFGMLRALTGLQSLQIEGPYLARRMQEAIPTNLRRLSVQLLSPISVPCLPHLVRFDYASAPLPSEVRNWLAALPVLRVLTLLYTPAITTVIAEFLGTLLTLREVILVAVPSSSPVVQQLTTNLPHLTITALGFSIGHDPW